MVWTYSDIQTYRKKDAAPAPGTRRGGRRSVAAAAAAASGAKRGARISPVVSFSFPPSLSERPEKPSYPAALVSGGLYPPIEGESRLVSRAPPSASTPRARVYYDDDDDDDDAAAADDDDDN